MQSTSTRIKAYLSLMTPHWRISLYAIQMIFLKATNVSNNEVFIPGTPMRMLSIVAPISMASRPFGFRTVFGFYRFSFHVSRRFITHK